MSTIRLRFERDLEFPSVIVWDALVDVELVAGWLGEAHIELEVGGDYDIVWLHRSNQHPTFGRIVELDPCSRLQIDTSNAGSLEFDLNEHPGGSRGKSVRLCVTIDVDLEHVFAARVRADWLTNLDQLDDLLHGHPVDWDHWERDRESAWEQHFEEEHNSTA